MQARILGAHQSETATKRFTAFLIDDGLAIDAGGLTSTLTLDEQNRIEDVLITHHHYDHVKDLGAFGFNRLGSARQVRIHCTAQVRDVLQGYLLNPGYWLNFFAGPDPGAPPFIFSEIVPGSSFQIGPYQILSVPVNHSVPATGFQVSRGGPAFFYTSDNGPGCAKHWIAANPDVLVTEVTYANAASTLASRVGHLWPSQLGAELELFRTAKSQMPRVIVIHVNPYYEDQIARELAVVAATTGIRIEIGYEGMLVEL